MLKCRQMSSCPAILHQVVIMGGMYKRRRPPHAFTPGQMLLILRQEPKMVALLQQNAVWLAVTPRTAWILDHCCTGQLEGGPGTAKETAEALGLVLPPPGTEQPGIKVPEQSTAAAPMDTDPPAATSNPPPPSTPIDPSTEQQQGTSQAPASDTCAAMTIDSSTDAGAAQQELADGAAVAGSAAAPAPGPSTGGTPPGSTAYTRHRGGPRETAVPWSLMPHCWMSVRLTLEETFFLQHVLGVLAVKRCEAAGQQPREMSDQELWATCTSIRPNFPTSYIGFHHLKCKGWIPRSGMLYGVDFVAYAMHPAAAHSHFSVLLLPLHPHIPAPTPPADSPLSRQQQQAGQVSAAARQQGPGMSQAADGGGGLQGGAATPAGAYDLNWHDLQITTRVVNTVAKKMIHLYIQELPSSPGRHTPDCIPHFAVEERIVRRWVPDAARD